MNWLSATPALLCALVVVTVPGLFAAWALRFRGLALAAATIALSIAIIAVTSIFTPIIGLAWSIAPVLLVGLLVGLVLLVVRRFVGPLPPARQRTRRDQLITAAAVIVAGFMVFSAIRPAIGDPANISQTFDAVFHLNAAARILDTGDASPFHMNISAPTQATVFYPTVWHATVALVVQVTGSGVPVATNAVALAVSAWVWPVAIIFFSRPFVARRPVHLILIGILAAGFTAFPYLLLAWGVLYPNLLSTALIPIALGFLYPALRYRAVGTAAVRSAPAISYWLAAFAAVGALALAHPNGVFGFALFTIPMLVVVANDVRRSPRNATAKIWRFAALGSTIILYIIVWLIVSTNDNSRSYEDNVFVAFMSAITNAPLVNSRSWFITVLVATGIVVLLITRRHRWLIGSYVLVVAFYTISSGTEGPVRDIFTGAWYNDAHRLAALLPIAAIPLAAIAATRLLDLLLSGIRHIDAKRVSKLSRQIMPVTGILVICALVLTGTRGHGMAIQTGWINELFTVEEDAFLLSEEELTLLNRLSENVPKDALIAGDPWTGTALAEALSGRTVLFPHLTGSFSNEATELAAEFNHLGAAACPLIEALGVDYVLDFGSPKFEAEVPEISKAFTGLREVGTSPILHEVDREGEAALYRVECPSS